MFSTIDTEEKAYWLGFLAADGCITVHKNGSKYIKLALAVKDKEHLEKFKSFLNVNNKISTYKTGNSRTSEKKYECCEIRIGSNTMAADLAVHGIVPRKSHTMKFPKLTKELVRHYIRGLWDGDGSVLYRARNSQYPNNFNPEVQLCGNKNILDSVQKVFEEELKIIPSKLSTASSIFLFRKSSSTAKEIIEYLYGDANIYLNRKYDKALLGMRWKPKHRKGGSSFRSI